MIVKLALAFLASGAMASAQPVTWTNTSGGNWSMAANWSPNQVPGPGDTAVLPGLASTYAVILDEAASVSNIIVGATNGGSTQTFSTGAQNLTVNGLMKVNAQGVFSLNGGILAGTNVLAGALTWSAGYLECTMTVSSNSVLNTDF